MKITKVTEVRSLHIETNGGGYNRYIRYSPDNWYAIMFDSNDQLTENYCKKMEKLYQEWLAENGGENSNQSDMKQVSRQSKRPKLYSANIFRKIK